MKNYLEIWKTWYIYMALETHTQKKHLVNKFWPKTKMLRQKQKNWNWISKKTIKSLAIIIPYVCVCLHGGKCSLNWNSIFIFLVSFFSCFRKKNIINNLNEWSRVSFIPQFINSSWWWWWSRCVFFVCGDSFFSLIHNQNQKKQNKKNIHNV